MKVFSSQWGEHWIVASETHSSLATSHLPLSCMAAGAQFCAERKRSIMSKTSYQRGCKEKYEELCAVSTTGELSQDEWADLREHVAAGGHGSFAAIPATAFEMRSFC